MAGTRQSIHFSTTDREALNLRGIPIKPITSGRAVISKQTAPVISDTPRVLGNEIAINRPWTAKWPTQSTRAWRRKSICNRAEVIVNFSKTLSSKF